MSAFPFRSITSYSLIVLLYYLLDYYRKYREREVRAAELESELAKAELRALQVQLQPHFLFNTLHAIGVLMHTEPETAHRMLAQLSDLLRGSLDELARPEIPLRQELSFVEKYLEIQRIRFRDRLDVRYRISPEARNALVPNLILQPLVENAIEHGIAPFGEAGVIEIRADRKDASLEVTVHNNGRPMTVPGSGFGNGIGLTNTRRRLERLYGPEHRLELRNTAGGGVEAIFVVPYRLASEAESPPEEER
jgi:LytS/YehU family sensor histidine kinase